MKRLLCAAFAALLLLLPASLAQTLQPQTPEPAAPATTINSPPEVVQLMPASVPEEIGEDDVVRVNITLVTVPVRVLDRKGKYVPDLCQENFRIYEDDLEQEIAYFAPAAEPATIALVLDTSGSTKFRFKEMQDAAIAFLDQLRPEDRVMVISFDDEIRVHAEFTSDRQMLQEAIRSTATGDSTRFYDAVDFVLKERLRSITGRKAVVLFTDGMDTSSRTATYSSNMREAEESDAMIYTVDYGPRLASSSWIYPSNPLRNETMASKRLRKLAEQTGGRAYRAESLRALTKAFAKVAAELRGQYSLGYYPKVAGQAGRRCRIRVGVSVPEVVVRARDSYVHAR